MWPWGWSEFIHSCGEISLEIIFQRYLQKWLLNLVDYSEFDQIAPAREDYVQDYIDDYDA